MATVYRFAPAGTIKPATHADRLDLTRKRGVNRKKVSWRPARLSGSFAPPRRMTLFAEWKRVARRGVSLDDQLSVHDHPVAGEGAEEGVASRLFRGMDVDRELLLGCYDVRVGQDIVGLGNIVPQDRFRVGDELVGQITDALKSAGFDEHPVVRHCVRIAKGDRQRLACPGLNRSRRVGEIRSGIDAD